MAGYDKDGPPPPSIEATAISATSLSQALQVTVKIPELILYIASTGAFGWHAAYKNRRSSWSL